MIPLSPPLISSLSLYLSLSLPFSLSPVPLFSFFPPDPPAILQPPQGQSVALNSTFVFVCITDGNPTPQISWHFNDAVIPGAVESSYTISTVAGTNGGQYTCRATNNIGTVSESATLTVLCKLIIILYYTTKILNFFGRSFIL